MSARLSEAHAASTNARTVIAYIYNVKDHKTGAEAQEERFIVEKEGLRV